MKFHLNHTPKKVDCEINHQSKLMLVGSCFAENIGALLSEYKFKAMINPNGILFNPISIENCLASILRHATVSENFILERDGLFYSYLHHSSFSALNKSDLISSLNQAMQNAHNFLQSSNVLVITFGTAFIYHHKQLNQTVANCHKQPAALYEKRLLEPDEIVNRYNTLIKNLREFNPNLKIIFTVSPVKYLKDGVEENNLSKSTLLLSIHKLIALNKSCFYFPAFELVNDDLRDYRFYKEDLAHPNQLAVEYIWQKFSQTYFNPQTLELNLQIHKLNAALNHKQIHENSLENDKLKAFIENQKNVILKLNPNVTLS